MNQKQLKQMFKNVARSSKITQQITKRIDGFPPAVGRYLHVFASGIRHVSQRFPEQPKETSKNVTLTPELK